MADAGADIIRYQGIGPLAKWVDDHIFFHIWQEFLDDYNRQQLVRHGILSKRGRIKQGGHLWFGGQTFAVGTLDEHVKDCMFPCWDLSSASP